MIYLKILVRLRKDIIIPTCLKYEKHIKIWRILKMNEKAVKWELIGGKLEKMKKGDNWNIWSLYFQKDRGINCSTTYAGNDAYLDLHIIQKSCEDTAYAVVQSSKLTCSVFLWFPHSRPLFPYLCLVVPSVSLACAHMCICKWMGTFWFLNKTRCCSRERWSQMRKKSQIRWIYELFYSAYFLSRIILLSLRNS